MSYQDTLMNQVYIPDGHPEDPLWVMCATCGPVAKVGNFDAANDIKIEHENAHGIFLDSETGELWYDPTDDCFATEK